MKFGEETFKIAGINNVITPKIYRGKGYASKILSKTETFLFKDLQSDFGLLLCADDLLPFYGKLGWYKVESTVYFEQQSGSQIWEANVMLLSRSVQIFPNVIDLNGLPW